MSTLSTCAQDSSASLNPMSFTDQHGNVVLERLRYQRETGRFCDVYIVVKDRQFCAHRNILAACSPYFDSILKNSKIVKEQVTVNCQNPAVFELLLNYMYSGSVVIDRSSVTDLLKLANNFLVTRVKNYCAEYLDRYMDSANCLTVKELALKYNLPALLKSACDFFDVNINRCLLESTDIVNFKMEQLIALLTEPKYSSAISPDVHLKLIVRWVGHDLTKRGTLFEKLLANCPIALVQSSTLEYLLDYSPFFINCQSARYAFMQLMSKNSILMAKYQAQYRALSTQFQTMKSDYYTQIYDGNSQIIDTDVSQKDKKCSASDCKPETETSQVKDDDKDNHITSEQRAQSISEDTGQPPVIGASTTDGVLNASEISDDLRPALKLKIHLNSINILNRKSRLLAAAGRHKYYRKSVTAANQVLAKRRGRPPKSKSFTENDYQKGDQSALINTVHPDCGIDLSEQVVFDDEDDADPCSGASESENETPGDNNETAEKPFHCDYCAHRSSTAIRLRHHIARAHTKNVVHVCPLCVFECRWSRDYSEHMKEHFNGPPFHCDLCEFTGERIISLLCHRLTHTDERPFKCIICKYKSRFKNNIISHAESHSADKPYHCTECGCSFPAKNTLDQHMAVHSAIRPYHCQDCDFSTKYLGHLVSHRRIHSGDSFHCHYEECTYSSLKKSQLAAHLRTHLGVRAYHCKTCNRSFIEKSHLVRHERIHLEDKPFKCDNCDYSSSRRDKLKEHIQKHHSSATGNKQHRRRYRRAKQLAQLAAQAKSQSNVESVFRPIQTMELDASSDGLTGSVPLNVLSVENSEFTHPEVRPNATDSQPQNSNVHSNCAQQTHTGPLLDFVTLNNTNTGNIGRPSSAMMPPTNSMTISPAMSLNFHIGTIMDSPIESLRTPVPRSPHSVSMHSVSEYYGNTSPAGAQDAQRPMSLPPYGGPPAVNNQLGPPWAW